MFVKEKLRPLVNKIHQLDDDDLVEVDAFLDYLLLGPQQLPEPGEGHPLKMYDFMEGGIEGEAEGKVEEKSGNTPRTESV